MIPCYPKPARPLLSGARLLPHKTAGAFVQRIGPARSPIRAPGKEEV